MTSGPRKGFKFSPAEACRYWSRMDAILANNSVVCKYSTREGREKAIVPQGQKKLNQLDCFIVICLLTEKTQWIIFDNKKTCFHSEFIILFFISVHYKSVILCTPGLGRTPPDITKPLRNRETEAANVNKMAAFHNSCFPKDLLSSLSAEVLYIILSFLPAKSLLNLSECNRRLRDLCQNCNSLWKHLCKVSCDSFDRKIKLYSWPYRSLSRQWRNYLISNYFTGKYKDSSILLSFRGNSSMFLSCLL